MTSPYDRPDLINQVTALLPEGTLSPRDLAPFDQFHVGGLKSTLALAELAEIHAGQRVLDVGCGVGGPSRALAALGCQVTGVDLSADYVALSRQLAERVGMAVEYQQADALSLPFADGAFDVVWTQHVSMNIADKEGFYREIARVLSPGGRLVFHDAFAGEGDLLLPVPWASVPQHSALVRPETVQPLLVALGFIQRVWVDATAQAQAFLSRLPDALPPLSLALLLGDSALPRMQTYRQNLAEGRVVVFEGVFEKTA